MVNIYFYFQDQMDRLVWDPGVNKVSALLLVDHEELLFSSRLSIVILRVTQQIGEAMFSS